MIKKSLIIGVLILVIIIWLLYFDGFNFGNNKNKITYNEVSKTYYAPKSKIKIIVNSKNYADQNQDLGNGTAFVKLFVVNAKNDTVYLKTSPENIDFITYKNKRNPFDCSQLENHKLHDYLILIGFKKLNKNEIAELRNAMTLINYGPKATLLKDQTKFIEVLE
jgi:hypothetical protein